MGFPLSEAPPETSPRRARVVPVHAHRHEIAAKREIERPVSATRKRGAQRAAPRMRRASSTSVTRQSPARRLRCDRVASSGKPPSSPATPAPELHHPDGAIAQGHGVPHALHLQTVPPQTRLERLHGLRPAEPPFQNDDSLDHVAVPPHLERMSREEHYRRLERAYAGAPINRFVAADLRVEKGASRITMRVRPEFFHGAGAVHGSIFFKLLDDAAYFAANSLVEKVFVLTVSFHVHFLRPITAGELTARGRLVQRGARLLVAESELAGERGRAVARGSGTFIPSEVPIPED
jgi:uncharacterized protein (TIGR00369 family)